VLLILLDKVEKAGPQAIEQSRQPATDFPPFFLSVVRRNVDRWRIATVISERKQKKFRKSRSKRFWFRNGNQHRHQWLTPNLY